MAKSSQTALRVLRDLVAVNEEHRSNRYTYLPCPPECIRLLALAPGKKGTDLYGRVITEELDEVNYGALSYVWGDPRLTRSLHIEDATLPITESLYSALQQIRQTDEESWIWVDQICIDQECLADRNEHVGRMGKIYGKADHVIAWLGEAMAATDYIFRSLDKIRDSANWGFNFYENEELEPGHPVYESINECLHAELQAIYHDKASIPDFEDTTRDAVHSILDSAWFKRTWTVQEAALCEKLFLAAGNQELTWGRFCGFLKAMPEFPRPNAVHHDIELTRMISCYGLQDTHLYRLVDAYQRRQATDPRDKVYGLLGLLDPKGYRVAAEKYGLADASHHTYPLLPQVDYSKPAEQVYMDFSLWCIHTTESLEVLTRCCSEYHPNNRLTLPSWARDWTQKLEPTRCGYLIGNVLDDRNEPFAASLDLKAQVRRWLCFRYTDERRRKDSNYSSTDFSAVGITIQENPSSLNPSPEDSAMHALLVKGFQFDIIEEIVDRVHIKGFLGDTQGATWREWKDFAMKNRPPDRDQYQDHQARMSALWRTLIKDQRAGHEERAVPEDGEHFEMMLEGIMAPSDAISMEDKSDVQDDEGGREDQHDQKDIVGWLFDHEATLFGKKLFRTQKGYLGMTCHHIRVGDKVAVLCGGRLPFVLREKGLVILDSDGGHASRIVMSHVFIGGNCYVHGLADGQAVEMSRAKGTEAVEICII